MKFEGGKGGGKFSKGKFRKGGFKGKPRRDDDRGDKRPDGKPPFKGKPRRDDERRDEKPRDGKPFKKKWDGKPRGEKRFNRDDAKRPDARQRGNERRAERDAEKRFDKPRDGKFGGKRRDSKFGDKPRDGKFGDKRRDGNFRNDKPHDKSHHDKPRFDGPRRERPPREESSITGARPSLYGFHAVRAAWLNPAREISALYISEVAEKEFEATLIEARDKGLRRPFPTTIEKHDLDRVLPREATHQGIAIAAAPLEEIFAQDLIIQSGEKEKTVLVMLDQITDPHNVGAILRSACAFNAGGVIMQRMHAPELSGFLAKTASGAIEHIPVAYETNLSRALEELKEAGFVAVGMDERAEKNIDEIIADKIVIVLGAEGAGLRRLVRENCNELAKLPASGPIQSLNVSNAAAIALYALSR